ncbi:LysE family translocator [Octadecabacter ascidiaceicola]|uniref:Cysteine/O-acetylserine efflux protein n=1 Tax=Octadecabacter ascidiaceicola TaxID=1655543 RepID=A0A238K521_9RHOB|nr:LysE family translocator [Octadecabacter ascidiaceicola]SMX37873.1 Cysteine/O-acetylserine efflux protein [Octadecabacter ascidiaceicola]
MSSDVFLTLITFAFVGTVTPGPNNAMLMASGANFGLRRTIPHMMGITLGFPIMIVLVGFGLMQIFDAFPVVDRTLKVVSIAYLLWLAYKIATAAPKLPDVPKTGGKPLTFLQASAFQWVNPKAWSMAGYAITRFATDADGARSLLAVGIVSFAFFAVSFPSVTVWTTLGQQMRRFLTSPARLRTFNIIMALLLVATLVPVVFPNLLGP